MTTAPSNATPVVTCEAGDCSPRRRSARPDRVRPGERQRGRDGDDAMVVLLATATAPVPARDSRAHTGPRSHAPARHPGPAPAGPSRGAEARPGRAPAARPEVEVRPSAKSRKKARDIAAERREIRLSLHAHRGPYCEGCPVTPVGDVHDPRPWTDLHEVLTRGRGGDPTDPGNILCLCRECHRWVTEHEVQARALGLVRARTAEEHAELFRLARPSNLTGGMVEA